MRLSEIDDWKRFEYIQKCSCCDMAQKILTQDDDFPEYHTKIYLQCQCGEFLEFKLPVN